MVPGHRREVAHHQDHVLGGHPLADEADDALLHVVAVDPLKAGGGEVLAEEGRLVPVSAVQVFHPSGERRVPGVVQQVPFQGRLVVPFGPLAELPPHEEQLLARLAVHVAQQQPQVGELLPVVPRHLGQEGPLAVDHFVVGQGQDEILRKGV